MPKTIYEAVYTGKIVAGSDKKQIVRNLAELFGAPRAEIPKLFSSRGAVIASFESRQRADSFVDTCRRAGVICEVREKGAQAPAPGKPVERAAPAARRTGGFNTVDIHPDRRDVTLAPRRVVRLGSHKSGITTQRRDVGDIRFTDITRLAVFTDEEKLWLMFFCRQAARPFMAESMEIAYADFPITPEPRAEDSLRKIALLILKGNPSIVIDSGTEAFLNGKRPVEHKRGPIALATALKEAAA